MDSENEIFTDDLNNLNLLDTDELIPEELEMVSLPSYQFEILPFVTGMLTMELIKLLTVDQCSMIKMMNTFL